MQNTEDKIKKCYAFDDDTTALSCIRGAIEESKAAKEECQPRMVLLVKDGCLVCKDEKKRYEADIKSGAVTLVDVMTPEGLEMAQKNEVFGVPAFLIVDCKNNIILD
jgi:hypothetical protein